jgi:TP901 family phage tail tape measure protein
MADIESNIRFGVDTTDAIASIKMLQAQISAFQRQMSSSSAANADSARKLRRGLLDDLNATGQWSTSIKTIKSSSESFTTALEKNKLSMGEYFRFAGASTKTFGKLFTTEFNTIEKVARERVKDLQTQYISLGRDANGALKSIAVRPLKLDMESLATQTAMNAQRQQIFNQLLKQGSTNLLNFGKNTQWAGRQLMVGFTIPLSIFGSMASKTFMELEEQAIRFKRVYGELFTPPEEADEMLETLKELGKEFTKYGVAVQKTLGLAADAAAMGKTGVELLDQVTEANRLAVLGSVEQQMALETTISLTNAFGVATEDLAKKIDFLNAVENQTVVSIEDLTIAIPKAGPVVQQLGGDVEDLAFFLTAMKEGGINASEGANALKSGLASLINPTGVASEMMKTFGINLQELNMANRGDVKGLVIDFAQALDELDPLQRAQAIEQLFGKFQFSRLSTLFQNVIQEGNQASRVLELTNATTQELAQLSNKELKAVEESTTFRFRKAIEEFQLAIAPVGEEFLKLITPIIEFANGIIEKFNGLSDGAKSFITGLTVLLGVVGPVALMTFGLLANGVANIIKSFVFLRDLFLRTGKQSNILGEQIDYMTTEQLNAAAVAASLDQTHQQLIQTFSVEAGAVKNLADVYRQAFNEQQRFDTGRRIAQGAGLRLASGILSVPGPKGAGDIVPAVLSPGEAVIPADAAKKYAPIIQGMIAGNLPGFSQGVMLGMPRSGKSTQKNREAAEEIYQMFLQSSYRDVPPTNYGHQLSPTSGHSFPIFGLGGVYMGPGGNKVFVKPVMDEKAAVAEMRATEIARRVHGLKAPEQRITVIRDPQDPKRQRRFLALESALDATFVNNDPMAMFNEDQYFKQLVASLLRVDKDLSASNVFGDVVADVGPAGVFSRASGLRDYAENLPSMEEQAMINLLGIKGGAKRAFAESTLALMQNLNPQQYHQRVISEIQQVLPLLEQTVASFNLTNPQEAKAYQDMIQRLRQGLSVDWSKFHAIHSAVKPSKPKQTTIPGYEDGVVSVPGPKGAGDVMPAMLSPGEAVIPADKAKKYAGFIQQMIYGKIPGYEQSNVVEDSSLVKLTQTRLKMFFGDSGTTRLQASHFQGMTPEAALETLRKDLALLGDEAKDSSVLVREYYEEVDESGKKVVLAKDSIMTLAEVVEKFADGTTKMAFGGQTFGASTVLESAVRNQKAYSKMESKEVMSPEERATIGKLGAPETLQDLVVQGDLAARALVQFKGKLTKEVQTVLENIVNEGNNAKAALASTNSAEEQLAFAISQREKSIYTHIRYADSTLTASQKEEKMAAVNQELENIKELYVKELQEGMSEQDALNKAVARLRMLALENSSYGQEGMLAMHVGDVPNTVIKQAAGNKISETSSSGRATVANFNSLQRLPVGLPTTAVVAKLVQDVLLSGVQSASINTGNLDAVMRQAVTDYFKTFNNKVINEMMDFAQINSPSDRTDDTIGRPLVEGMEAGALSGKDDMQQAGAILAETAADSVAATAGAQGASGAVKVGRRRVTTFPDAIAAYEADQQTQTNVKKKPRRASAPTTDFGREAREQAQTAALVAEANRDQAESVKTSQSRLDKMNSVLMQGTFALTSLAGVGVMAGGVIGQISQKIFEFSGLMFGLMQITQMLTQAKILELIQSQAKKAADAIEIATTAGKIAANGGFIASMITATIAVQAFLGPIGLITIAIAAAIGGIMLLAGFMEDQKKKVNGLGDAAFLTAEKMKKAGELLGFTPKTTEFGQNIKQGTAAARGADEASMITDLRSSEDFKTSFSAEIDTIRNATKGQAEAALASVSNQLFAAGASQEQVDAYVRAIAQEAERTDLSFSFAKIDFAKDGAKQIVDSAMKASSAYVDTFNKNITARFDKDGNVLVRSTSFGKEGLQGIKTFAGSLASSFQSLKDGLANNLITAAQFQEGLDGVMGSLEGLDAGQLGLVLPDLYEKLGVEDLMKEIPLVGDQLLLLQADAAGIEIPEADKNALKNADKSAKAASVALRVRTKLKKQVEQQAENQEKLNKKNEEDLLINEKISGAAVSLVERNIQLEEQSTAYDLLIEKGYSAGDAFKYAGDAGLAAGLAAAAGIAEATGEVDELNRILDLIEKNKIAEANAPKSPGGGGGDKSPYEESIESLKEQRKEIINSNIAFAKLRQAGLDTASAMQFAEDPITAAALATTKVGTDKWNQLIKSIKTTQALLSKKEIQDLLRGGKIEKADKQAQVAVSSALGRLGWTAEQIDAALSDQEFTNTLAKDLKDGKIDSQDLLNRLIQIKQLENLDIALNFTTKEGAADEFQKRYDKVVGYLEARKQTIEVDFQVKTFDDSVIARKAEEDIALRQNAIDDYEAELVGIDEQEEEINKTYEERKKALDKISKSNEDIARQQKSQLTLADALSQGDIAAAARAAQEMRAQNADAQINKQGELLELSKEKALANVRTKDGRSRKQIEEDIKKLKKEIFDIEENRLEPARENIRLAEVEKNAKLDSINQQILRWDVLSARVNEAKLKLTPEEMSAMEYQAGLIADLLEKWDQIEDKEAILTIIKKTIGEATGETGDGGSGGGGAGSSSTTTSSTTDGNGGSGQDDNKDDKKDPTPAEKSAAAFKASGMSVSGFMKKQDSAAEAAAKAKRDAQLKAEQAKSTAAFKASGQSVAAFVKKQDSAAEAAQAKAKKEADQRAIIAADKKPKPKNALDQIDDAINWLGDVTHFKKNMDQLFGIKLARGGMVNKYAGGGMVKYMADGGLFSSLGTDIVPAMLTPGEFVVRRNAVNNFGTDNLKAINSGTYKGDSVYNYEVNVNVQTNSDPNQIATAVIGKIRQIESQKIRGNRF